MTNPSKSKHHTLGMAFSPAQSSALFQGSKCAVLCFLWEPTCLPKF
jgi:hypothetical protein